MSESEKNLAVVLHVSVIIAALITSWVSGFAGALVALAFYLVFPSQSVFVREHARETFNFNATVCLLAILGFIVTFVTFGLGLIIVAPLALILFIYWVYSSVMATIAAKNGENYKFKFSIPFLKK